MTSKEFWSYVENQKDELIALRKKHVQSFRESGDPAALEGQPEDTKIVFIVSKRSLDRGTEPGHVCLTHLRIAAQRMIEGTHEVASATQIAQYLKEREVHQAEVRRMNDIRREASGQVIQNVWPGMAPQMPAGYPVGAGGAATHERPKQK